MEKWREEIAEIRALIAETSRFHAEALSREAALREEALRRQEEALSREAALREEALRQEKERGAKLDAHIEKTLKSIDGLNAQTRGIGESNGKFSETYFYNTLYNTMRFGGRDFDEIDKGLRRGKKLPGGKKLEGEYDVIMYNGNTVALIEIKYRVRKDDADYLINKQINNFKVLFPKYAGYEFYLGIAGMSFEDGAEDAILEKGIGVLKPKGENVEIIDRNLKVY